MSQEYSRNLPGKVMISITTALSKEHLVPQQWIHHYLFVIKKKMLMKKILTSCKTTYYVVCVTIRTDLEQ